eukprot:22491_1
MTYCVNHNAQLATFKTLDDLTSIKQICDQSECDNYCWLGFLDPDYDGQYTFIDGTMVDHNIIPWGEHPEDYHNQDCGCIVKTSKHSAVDIWDCSCAYSSHGFICETVEQPLPSKYWPIPCGTISSWNEGKTYCEDNNAKLATAGSVIDLQAIKKACDEAGSCHYCWGGWSDPDFDGQYTFVDGTPVDHSKIPWTETHPEDYFDHDCGCIPQTSKHASLGIWDCSCHHASYSAVCESLMPTPRPSSNPTISPIPTRTPTSYPSSMPTKSPIPTNEPTLNPSKSPITFSPTPIPTTTNPTSQPKYWSAPCGIASTWHKAMTYCVNHNAQLATFKTLDDLTSIKQICDQSECDNYCWLGFLDPDYDGQYTFIDGTMVDHNIIPWGEHPEDYHNQDCGCIVKTSKHSAVDIWDCSCAYSSHGFICETVEQP